MKYATGLASQDFNGWLSNLSNLDTKRYGATAGEAGTFGALGGAALSTGANEANLNFSGNAAIGQAGAQGLMAGQQAAVNRFGAMMGGLNLLGQPMRLEAVSVPDPLHGAQRDPDSAGHGTAGPVGDLTRRLRAGQRQHLGHRLRRMGRRARRTRLVAQ